MIPKGKSTRLFRLEGAPWIVVMVDRYGFVRAAQDTQPGAGDRWSAE